MEKEIFTGVELSWVEYLLELMSRKHKKVFTTLNNIEHFFILASATTGYISISAFATLLCMPIGIISSSIGLKSKIQVLFIMNLFSQIMF